MRILLVDNNTKHIEDIKKLCSKYEVIVKRWNEITSREYEDFDLIVLSGGTGMAIENHEQDLATEMELIRRSDKPIIGVCLGFELICHVYGSKMEKEDVREKGIIEIDVLLPDPVFVGREKLRVYMAHKWHVKDVGPELTILASSHKGIDAVKHKTRPMYGFQFHPEILEEANNGAEVFNKCLDILTS